MPLRKGESLEDYNRRMTEEAHSAWNRAHPEYGTTVMPHVDQMLRSKYLSTKDLPQPVVAHIRGVAMEPAGRQNEDPRWLMYFQEIRKPLKLNNTILNYLAQMLGPNSDGWVGVKCQLYNDTSVQFGGQYVGGVRLRVAKSAQRPVANVTQEFYQGAAGVQPPGPGGPVFAGLNPSQPSAGAGAPPQQGRTQQQPGGIPGQANGQQQAPQQQWRPPNNAVPDEFGEYQQSGMAPGDPDFNDDIPF